MVASPAFASCADRRDALAERLALPHSCVQRQAVSCNPSAGDLGNVCNGRSEVRDLVTAHGRTRAYAKVSYSAS